MNQLSHYADWSSRTSIRGKSGVPELLKELSALGFAWRDVAKMIGVSIPAIQKWRRGDGVTGINRQKLACLLAACDLIVESYGVQDVASWFEMPVAIGVPVTPIDFWSHGRPELVFEHASGHIDGEGILSAFDSDWREVYRSDYEVFEAPDGQRAIRLRES